MSRKMTAKEQESYDRQKAVKAQERETRLAKLPVWARDEIKRLEMRVAERDKKIDQMTDVVPGEESKTNVFIYGWAGEANKPLPKDTTIEFHLENGAQFAVQLASFNTPNGKEMLSIHDITGRSLSIRPSASNMVYLEGTRS